MRSRSVIAALCALPLLSTVAVAQDEPESRRPLDGPPTVLAFKKVSVEDLIPFMVEATGKVVMPQPDVLSRQITVLNDRPIPRNEALDLVVLALQQNGIAVVESDGVISLRDISEIVRQDVPVLGPDQSVLARRDRGSIVQKVFRIRHGSAKNMGELLEDDIPDYAKLAVDEDSNQIAVLGNIALLQRIERLVASLDTPSSDALQTETFRLRYADAASIAENITALFEPEEDTSNENNNFGPGRFFGRGGNNNEEDAQSAARSQDLRVTSNAQQNAVTVVAEPAVLEQIRMLIETEWDRPLPDEAVIPKIYTLENSDPIKVRDLLEATFGQPTAAATTGGGATRTGGRNTQTQPTSSGQSQGVGRLAGQFSFQALPEAGRLLVVAKSPDNLAVIDKIIQELDQPQSVGLPAIIELKHASAEELAEQLNALLAQDGTLAQIPRQESGLSDSSSNTSPFSQDQDTATDDASQQTQASSITFWWQRSRPPEDSRGPSNMISQLRIVPVWRQNALLVLAPPEYKASITDLIESLDQPGRQVLISAVVAEVSRDDATSLGFRWSSDAINLTNADNSLAIGLNTQNTQDDFIGALFNTSVLNVNADLNLVLQALAQNTGVNILSEPKIFTSDNQEAEFFDGQDIAFPVSTQTTDAGGTIQTTDYRAVGIQLRARPRITPNRNVDLRVNLELAAIRPGEIINGGIVVDRRETTTQLIVQSGQTVVISGILRSEETDIRRKVPLLGDIPLIGLLFQSRDKVMTDSELLVFITPIVVENAEDVGELNAPFIDTLDRLRQQREDKKK